MLKKSILGRAEVCFIASLCIFAVSLGCSSSSSGGGGGSQSSQIDRGGFPVVNSALIPSAMKDSFNTNGDPSTDVANFRTVAGDTVMGLRTAVNGINGFPAEDGNITVDTVLSVTIPSVLAVDFSQTVAFPNGRRFSDDVMDAVLGVVLDRGTPLNGGAGISDAINSNDRTFSSTFPFLPTPN